MDLTDGLGIWYDRRVFGRRHGFHNLGWDLCMMEFDSNDTFCRKRCPSFMFYFCLIFLSLMIHTFVSSMDGSMAFGLDWAGKVEGVYHACHEWSFRIYHEED